MNRILIKIMTVLIIAGVVNTGIFVFLSLLNSRLTAKPESVPAMRMVTLPPPAPEPEPDQQKEERPEEMEPEPLVVNLDIVEPEPLPLEPIDISLNLPEMSFSDVKVSVKPQTKVVKKTTPTPRQPVPPKRHTGPMSENQVDEPPRELAGNARPAFPTRERRLGKSGKVVVRLLIDENGQVENVEVIEGDGGFRRAVLRVVKNWRFTPARDEGQVVKVWGVKVIRFELKD